MFRVLDKHLIYPSTTKAEKWIPTVSQSKHKIHFLLLSFPSAIARIGLLLKKSTLHHAGQERKVIAGNKPPIFSQGVWMPQ